MTDHKFNVGDRVQWRGFVKRNGGEPDRPVGTLGTVYELGFGPGVVYIQWDGGNGVYDYPDSTEGYSGATWAVNVAPAPVESPTPTGDPELRERMLELALKTRDMGDTYDYIVKAAAAFEAYVLGGAK